MKVVILAGGYGTRLAGETEVKPKPMVEIGGKPILWHIMKHYAYHGFKEFILPLGYKGDVIKGYFLQYASLCGDFSINLKTGSVENNEGERDDWVVHLVDTGLNTQTGGRIKRLETSLNEEPFLVTYGDGVSDIDIKELVRFHNEKGRLATVTAVRPPARFGSMVFDEDQVIQFTEKPQIGEGWISGGFLVFEPEVFDYLDDDETILEAHALERLAEEGQLTAYRHEGFWQCMDTPRDLRLLQNLWDQDRAPWKVDK